MATYTENYNLEKPAQSDLYNIDVFNENADKIDEALGSKASNQSLAPIESTSTATRNYSIGQQFVYNGLLYEATSAIASGGTITPGSNCARTTVAEELSALNDSLTYKSGDVITLDGAGVYAGASNAAGTEIPISIPLPKAVSTLTNVTANLSIGWIRAVGTDYHNQTLTVSSILRQPNVLNVTIAGTFPPKTVLAVNIAGSVTVL